LKQKKKKKDINECTLGFDNCHFDATCTNTNGSFACTCKTGYSGNGITCNGNFFLSSTLKSFKVSKKKKKKKKDINECLTNNGGCDVNAICINDPGSFNCSCKVGYSGNGLNCSGVIH